MDFHMCFSVHPFFSKRLNDSQAVNFGRHILSTWTCNLKKWAQKVLEWLALRRQFWAIRLLALPKFIKKHNRWPRNPGSSRATFEDYVFRRMTGPFTAFEETCVDKEQAKSSATALSPGLLTAKTVSVMPLAPDSTLEQVGKFIYPFIGKAFVAKPTHTSGGIVFLGSGDLKAIVQQTFVMYQFARQNFFFNEYEVQYMGLKPKIIVEESLSSGNEPGKTGLGHHPPPDFRFYAAKGRVLFCQYDEGRFADHRQALFTVPEHRHIPIPDAFPLPNPLPEKPAHWEEMLQRASDLSKPFDFVRVDLYDLPDGVYFSEFTFTPNATLFPFRDPAFSRKLLEDVLNATSK
jgi:hypothetical protein